MRSNCSAKDVKLTSLLSNQARAESQMRLQLKTNFKAIASFSRWWYMGTVQLWNEHWNGEKEIWGICYSKATSSVINLTYTHPELNLILRSKETAPSGMSHWIPGIKPRKNMWLAPCLLWRAESIGDENPIVITHLPDLPHEYVTLHATIEAGTQYWFSSANRWTNNSVQSTTNTFSLERIWLVSRCTRVIVTPTSDKQNRNILQ
jgi:hypothetical protein